MISQADLDAHRSWAQCAACGATFLTDSLFEEHRRGPEGTRSCRILPAWVKHRGVWGTAEGHRSRIASAGRIRSARSRSQGHGHSPAGTVGG